MTDQDKETQESEEDAEGQAKRFFVDPEGTEDTEGQRKGLAPEETDDTEGHKRD